VRVLLATCGAWRLPITAKAFENRGALAGLWVSWKNQTAVAPRFYRRCWPFHLALKPFLHLAPQIRAERAFYALFPLWRAWFHRQPWPQCDVVQAVMGYATEPFDRAEKTGALKVVDCPNSHPASYQGNWQRECDRWCPGEKLPIPQWMFDRMTRELHRADMILCTSEFVRDSMLANGLPAEKCFLNPTGVDADIFQPRTQVPARPRFICVGTICLRKGHQYLFRAFAQVKQKLPDAELICVGGHKNDFRRELPRWQNTFTHHPKMNHAELATLLRTCTAFVLASVEEGFARVVIEALASGLPVVATYETGATTLVRDGVQGYIVPVCNPEKLAEAMIAVAQDRALNQRMGEAARLAGTQKNSWQDYGDRLLAEFAARIKNKNTR
jgi:glycosyltransferase involved in cell wall biosynthesis